MNYMEAIMYGPEQVTIDKLNSQTFGHFFPTVRYSEGEIIILTNDHGITSIFKYEIEDMSCSPWLYDAVTIFLDEFCNSCSDNSHELNIFKVRVSATVQENSDGTEQIIIKELKKIELKLKELKK